MLALLPKELQEELWRYRHRIEIPEFIQPWIGTIFSRMDEAWIRECNQDGTLRKVHFDSWMKRYQAFFWYSYSTDKIELLYLAGAYYVHVYYRVGSIEDWVEEVRLYTGYASVGRLPGLAVA